MLPPATWHALLSQCSFLRRRHGRAAAAAGGSRARPLPSSLKVFWRIHCKLPGVSAAPQARPTARPTTFAATSTSTAICPASLPCNFHCNTRRSLVTPSRTHHLRCGRWSLPYNQSVPCRLAGAGMYSHWSRCNAMRHVAEERPARKKEYTEATQSSSFDEQMWHTATSGEGSAATDNLALRRNGCRLNGGRLAKLHPCPLMLSGRGCRCRSSGPSPP